MNSTSAGEKDFSASIRNPNGRRSCVFTAILIFVFSGCTARALFAKRKPPSQQSTMAHAEQLLKKQHYKQAIKAFKRLNARQGKGSADCYWGITQGDWGLAQEQTNVVDLLNHLKKTQEDCDKVLKYAGWNVRLKVLAHNKKALAAEQMGIAGEPRMFKEGVEEFRVAYELGKGYPDGVQILFNLGIAEIRAGETRRGVATLKDYVARSPQSQSAEEARRVIAAPRLAQMSVAPNFSLITANGQTYNLQQLRGKIILLDFWGSWCVPCRRSVSELIHINKKFSGKPFVMISISSDVNFEQWRQFIRKKKMDWPQYMDLSRRILRAYAIHLFPTYVLIDQDGAIALREYGASPENALTLEDAIKKELAALASAKQEHRT